MKDEGSSRGDFKDEDHSFLAKKLKSFSTTHFFETHSSIVIFKDLLSAVIRVLHLFSSSSHRESLSQASQSMHAISDLALSLL